MALKISKQAKWIIGTVLVLIAIFTFVIQVYTLPNPKSSDRTWVIGLRDICTGINIKTNVCSHDFYSFPGECYNVCIGPLHSPIDDKLVFGQTWLTLIWTSGEMTTDIVLGPTPETW